MAHGRGEMSRAVLEGVAFNLRLILDALESQGTTVPSVRLIGGGAKSDLWPQMLADVFARPIHLLALKAEATSWGAAVAGGMGIGLYRGWNMAQEQARVRAVVEPDTQNAARYAELAPLFQETYCALEPIYAKIR